MPRPKKSRVKRKFAQTKSPFMRFVYGVFGESDRGSTLVIGELLTEELELLLKAKLSQNGIAEKLQNEVLLGRGIASDLYSRTVVCRLFNVIDHDILDAIDLIRKIRNHFAHHIGYAEFTDDEILQKVRDLQGWVKVKRGYKKWKPPPRLAMYMAYSHISAAIKTTIKSIEGIIRDQP